MLSGAAGRKAPAIEAGKNAQGRSRGAQQSGEFSPLVPKVSEALWERQPRGLKLRFPPSSQSRAPLALAGFVLYAPRRDAALPSGAPTAETEFRRLRTFPKRSANFGNEAKMMPAPAVGSHELFEPERRRSP